jgi:hypothetical protein
MTPMIRPFRLGKIFAAVGFCMGILISVYLLYLRIDLGAPAGAIAFILFPTVVALVDYSGGKILLACLLLGLSVVNGFLYAVVGLVVVHVVVTLRERLARPSV